MGLLDAALTGFTGGFAKSGADNLQKDIDLKAKTEAVEKENNLEDGRRRALEKFKSDLGIEKDVEKESRLKLGRSSEANEVQAAYDKLHANDKKQQDREDATREKQDIAVSLGYNDHAKALGEIRREDAYGTRADNTGRGRSGVAQKDPSRMQLIKWYAQDVLKDTSPEGLAKAAEWEHISTTLPEKVRRQSMVKEFMVKGFMSQKDATEKTNEIMGLPKEDGGTGAGEPAPILEKKSGTGWVVDKNGNWTKK